MSQWRGPAVIVDCDGTLVDVTSIRHHVVPGLPGWAGRKDFDAFHKASVWCPPIHSTLAAVEEHRAAGRAILIMTARMRRWEPHTRGWLATHSVRFDHLFMRTDGDRRPDTVVKAELLAQARAMGWDPTHAIDDNPSVVGLWESEGLDVTVVPGWVG